MFLLCCDAPDRQSLIWPTFVFGVGIDAPSRYSASIARVKSSFLRRSGVRNADANALSTDPPAAKLVYGRDADRRMRRRPGSPMSAQANSRRFRAYSMRPRTGPATDGIERSAVRKG